MHRIGCSFVILNLLCLSALFAQWEPDLRLTYADGHSVMTGNGARAIATCGDTIYLVWTDYRDGNSEIYYKNSTDMGSNWGPDTRLTNNSAISAQSTIAAAGLNLHVAWYDTRDSNVFEIYYKRSPDGGVSWGPDTRLTYDPEYSWYPSLALTNTKVHVAWRESRAGNYEVFYKRSTDNGATWGPDTNLSNAPQSSETPCIAASGSALHVTWFDNRDGGSYEIYYKRSTDEGATWGPDVRLTNDPGVSMTTCAAVSGPNVNVLWQDSRDGNWEIYYKRSTDGGTTWGPDTRLTNALQTSEAPSAVTSGANIHVVWWDNRDLNYEIYYKRSSDRGATWDPDLRLTSDSSWSQNPQIAFADTVLHVIWFDGRIATTNNELFYKRNRTGNLGAEEGPGGKRPVDYDRAGATIISGPLILPGNARFKVYDISGRIVNPHRMAVGVYFIETEGRVARKIVKVK